LCIPCLYLNETIMRTIVPTRKDPLLGLFGLLTFVLGAFAFLVLLRPLNGQHGSETNGETTDLP